MTTYLFNDLHYKPLVAQRGRLQKASQTSDPLCHVALPVMGIRDWILFFVKRVPLICMGAAVIFHISLILISLSISVLYSVVNPPVTTLMMTRLADERTVPQAVKFVPLKEIPEYAQIMFIRLEDKNFYTHNGIDLGAIQYAYEQNRRWGRVVMGGSTITQQLVRSLILSPEKSYMRKYVEAIIAVVLDTVVDKRRILELYLNYIEWGKGVYGIGAAAEYYFRKPVSSLNYDEFSRLATIIINPLDYGVYDFNGNPSMMYRYLVLTGPPPSSSPTPSVTPHPSSSPTPSTTLQPSSSPSPTASAAPTASPASTPSPSPAPTASPATGNPSGRRR